MTISIELARKFDRGLGREECQNLSIKQTAWLRSLCGKEAYRCKSGDFHPPAAPDRGDDEFMAFLRRCLFTCAREAGTYGFGGTGTAFAYWIGAGEGSGWVGKSNADYYFRVWPNGAGQLVRMGKEGDA